jgi:hypothetical protein
MRTQHIVYIHDDKFSNKNHDHSSNNYQKKNSYHGNPRGPREHQAEVYSEKVRAGKRMYFFDIRATRNGDFYLSIAEAVRKETGQEKHKIFVYKEDINKFVSAMEKTVQHLKEELLPNYDFETEDH